MGYVKLKEEHLRNIAEAIRAKRYVQTKWTPGEMAQAITDINVDNKAAEMVNGAIFDTGYSYSWRENASVMILTVNEQARTLTTQYAGGSLIGWRYIVPMLIPPIFSKLHYKITTGASSYDETYRFSPAVGLLPASFFGQYVDKSLNIYLGNNSLTWLKMDYISQRNSEKSGEFDLSDVSEPYLLGLCAPGWDCVFSEIYFS